MEYRLTHIAVHRTALMVAAIYGIVMLIFVPILYFATRGMGGEGMSTPMLVVAPLLYFAAVYVFTALGCWLYNLVSGWIGGVAFTLEPTAPSGYTSQTAA